MEQASEAIRKIRQRMKAVQSRQKSYTDEKRRPLEFEAGDTVFLKTSPMKGVMRFCQKGKLSPRYVGPFEILERVGKVAYQLALPPAISGLHDVFHVLMLRKYVADPAHILKQPEVEITPNLKREVRPEKILGRSEKQLRNRAIPLVQVKWEGHATKEATWEQEDEIREKYPALP